MKTKIKSNSVEVLKKVDFPKGLEVNQTFEVLIWILFNKRRFNKFIELCEKGMSLHYAFIDSKCI